MLWMQRGPSALTRLLSIGVSEADDEDLRTSKATLTLVSAVIAALGSVWVVAYFVVGRPLSASIPLVYQLASVASMIVFARTKRFKLLRFHQLLMIGVFPFLLQWSLGGYVQGSALSLWALTTPALAFMFGARATPWFVLFATLTIVSGLVDPWLRDASSQAYRYQRVPWINLLAACNRIHP